MSMPRPNPHRLVPRPWSVFAGCCDGSRRRATRALKRRRLAAERDSLVGHPTLAGLLAHVKVGVAVVHQPFDGLELALGGHRQVVGEEDEAIIVVASVVGA